VILRDAVLPANQRLRARRKTSRDARRVVSDVSVLCPRVAVS
jgi:hypothetical protein